MKFLNFLKFRGGIIIDVIQKIVVIIFFKKKIGQFSSLKLDIHYIYRPLFHGESSYVENRGPLEMH